MKILLDEKKCSACGACAIACMDQHDIDLSAGEQSFRRVYVEEKDGGFSYHSDACRHCKVALCMEVCPAEAIVRDPATGFVVVEKEYCLGCRKCARACPFGAISFDRLGRAQKCDGCYVRVQNGLPPACVAICPTGALSLEE